MTLSSFCPGCPISLLGEQPMLDRPGREGGSTAARGNEGRAARFWQGCILHRRTPPPRMSRRGGWINSKTDDLAQLSSLVFGDVVEDRLPCLLLLVNEAGGF